MRNSARRCLSVVRAVRDLGKLSYGQVNRIQIATTDLVFVDSVPDVFYHLVLGYRAAGVGGPV